MDCSFEKNGVGFKLTLSENKQRINVETEVGFSASISPKAGSFLVSIRQGTDGGWNLEVSTIEQAVDETIELITEVINRKPPKPNKDLLKEMVEYMENCKFKN